MSHTIKNLSEIEFTILTNCVDAVRGEDFQAKEIIEEVRVV